MHTLTRTGCIIWRAQCKMKIWGSLFKTYEVSRWRQQSIELTVGPFQAKTLWLNKWLTMKLALTLTVLLSVCYYINAGDLLKAKAKYNKNMWNVTNHQGWCLSVFFLQIFLMSDSPMEIKLTKILAPKVAKQKSPWQCPSIGQIYAATIHAIRVNFSAWGRHSPVLLLHSTSYMHGPLFGAPDPLFHIKILGNTYKWMDNCSWSYWLIVYCLSTMLWLYF